MKAAAPLVRWMMRRSLLRAFRRVAWIGPPPALPEGVPVILYANHHNFYDGYLGWLVAAHLLDRPAMTWMEEWDRFPFFGAVGALPFPPGDPRRRAATVRRTLRRFDETPSSVLVYFPEGRLHPPEEGLLPFDPALLHRLGRLLPACRWWPVGIHVAWGTAPRPSALLAGGPPHAAPAADTPARLAAAWQAARRADPDDGRTLLGGRPAREERWNFSFARRFFER